MLSGPILSMESFSEEIPIFIELSHLPPIIYSPIHLKNLTRSLSPHNRKTDKALSPSIVLIQGAKIHHFFLYSNKKISLSFIRISTNNCHLFQTISSEKSANKVELPLIIQYLNPKNSSFIDRSSLITCLVSEVGAER